MSSSPSPDLATRFGSFRSASEASAFERWRASLVNLTGLGLSDEDKLKRDKLKGLELEEAQWRRCEAWKNDLMKNSPVVVFMLKHLALHQTNLTSAHIHCAPCDPTRAGGFSPEAGILLCQDRFMSKSHMQDTLACARRRAILSVMANPACKSQQDAERAVNEVWESCFKDTRPFDEIY
ncbi:unnamed protein product [Rhizoctonia solani]|uniref:Mitochondrial inner membrane protease ATP23 n=1 Tax=Rhizoctonia solani TaxID=456999 RepID=A0A8H3AUL3_9AGAM|nr:unnamed protein product [Rhizoctonia solani]